MSQRSISPDDLLDIVEMTKKLESYISKTFKENELDLCVSALMSACINTLIGQCKTLDEVDFYRNLFINFFDTTIKSIQVREKEEPSSF